MCRGAQMRSKCDRLNVIIHSQDANLTVDFVFGWVPCMAVCLEHQKETRVGVPGLWDLMPHDLRWS